MENKVISKESLFNEVKGSLFEYLTCKELSILSGKELDFITSIDKNYSRVLSQQDLMIRQFYPELLPFLVSSARLLARHISEYFGGAPNQIKLLGKLSHSFLHDKFHEADMVATYNDKEIPLSLKLSKKNSYVNTKSGGVKSFFTNYFPFISEQTQKKFNEFVDLDFNRMAFEIHEEMGLQYNGNFLDWIDSGLPELPGELPDKLRLILKGFYSNIAFKMYEIFQSALIHETQSFIHCVPKLLGFSDKDVIQIIFYHDFPKINFYKIFIHSFLDLENHFNSFEILPFNNTSFVEFKIGTLILQVRVKPMNKFTTSSLKINCSVKFS